MIINFKIFENSKYDSLIRKIQSVLTPDLLKGMWAKEFENPLAGHCYAATEALYWMLGGPESDWKTYVLSHLSWPEGLDEGETHWFMRNSKGEILDPTAGQFEGQEIAYDKGRYNSMMNYPKGGSKRAREIMRRLSSLNENIYSDIDPYGEEEWVPQIQEDIDKYLLERSWTKKAYNRHYICYTPPVHLKDNILLKKYFSMYGLLIPIINDDHMKQYNIDYIKQILNDLYKVYGKLNENKKNRKEVDPYGEEQWDEICFGDIVNCIDPGKSPYLKRNVDYKVTWSGEGNLDYDLIKVGGSKTLWKRNRFIKKELNENKKHKNIDSYSEEIWDVETIDDPPSTWEDGDIIVCTNKEGGGGRRLEIGKEYTIFDISKPSGHAVWVKGDNTYYSTKFFKKKKMIKKYTKYLLEHEDVDPYGEEIWNEMTFDQWHALLQNMDEVEIDDFEEGEYNYILFWHTKTGSKFELDVFYNRTILFYYLDPNSKCYDSKVDEVDIKDISKEHLLNGMKDLILKHTSDVWKEYLNEEALMKSFDERESILNKKEVGSIVYIVGTMDRLTFKGEKGEIIADVRGRWDISSELNFLIKFDDHFDSRLHNGGSIAKELNLITNNNCYFVKADMVKTEKELAEYYKKMMINKEKYKDLDPYGEEDDWE
jgi:hypothetical protein